MAVELSRIPALLVLLALLEHQESPEKMDWTVMPENQESLEYLFPAHRKTADVSNALLVLLDLLAPMGRPDPPELMATTESQAVLEMMASPERKVLQEMTVLPERMVLLESPEHLERTDREESESPDQPDRMDRKEKLVSLVNLAKMDSQDNQESLEQLDLVDNPVNRELTASQEVKEKPDNQERMQLIALALHAQFLYLRFLQQQNTIRKMKTTVVVSL